MRGKKARGFSAQRVELVKLIFSLTPESWLRVLRVFSPRVGGAPSGLSAVEGVDERGNLRIGHNAPKQNLDPASAVERKACPRLQPDICPSVLSQRFADAP